MNKKRAAQKIQKKQKRQRNLASDEVEQLKRQLARALADYDNLSKRVKREQEGFVKFANANIITKLLPIYDMLISAQDHLSDSGLAITIEEFKNVLKEEGVQEIKAEAGDEFDEELFEAVEVIEDNKKSGTVAKVLLPGWRFTDGPVIRTARVKVYK